MALFDLLMAMGVIGVLIVGAILLFHSVSRSNEQAGLVQLARALRGGAERLFTGHGSYTGLGMAALCNAGVVPEGNMVGTSCASTSFVTALSYRDSGDSVGAWPLILSGTDPKGFSLGFAALDNATCAVLLGGYVGRNRDRSGFAGAAVRNAGPNGNLNWGAQLWTVFTASPLSQANIGTLCARGDGRNTVYLGFR